RGRAGRCAPSPPREAHPCRPPARAGPRLRATLRRAPVGPRSSAENLTHTLLARTLEHTRATRKVGGTAMPPRVLLALASAMLAVSLAEGALAQATSWPEKPVKLILPYAPGGATDLIGRPWADKLSQVMGQQFVIETRGGAGGMLGTEAAAKAPADGYTFLLTPNATLTILPSLRSVPYDALKSFEPVGRMGDLVSGFVIHPAIGVKDFPEMIAYAKQHPGKLAYGSAGLGTATQLRIEMLKYRAGIDILH